MKHAVEIKAKDLKAKEIAALSDKIARAKSIVIVDYRGISVINDTALRATLRKENIEYKVVKNRLFARALAEHNIQGMEAMLEGPSAFAFSFDDPVSAARLLADKVKHNQLKFKGGIVEGKVLSNTEIAAVASIPPKNVLVAQLLGMLQSPIRSLAVAISEIAKAKGE